MPLSQISPYLLHREGKRVCTRTSTIGSPGDFCAASLIWVGQLAQAGPRAFLVRVLTGTCACIPLIGVGNACFRCLAAYLVTSFFGAEPAAGIAYPSN